MSEQEQENVNTEAVDTETVDTEETVKTNLTDEEKEELDLLVDALKEGETLEESDKIRLKELQSKVKSEEVTTESEETSEESSKEQSEEEIIETEAEEVSSEEEANNGEVLVRLSKEMEEGYVARYYTIKTIATHDSQGKLLPENRLWGTYRAYLSNGLACRTDCFAVDEDKDLKVGETIELPETATIRQSNRKITKEEVERAKRENKPIIPTVFDWLHF
jgi:hypothetical protein